MALLFGIDGYHQGVSPTNSRKFTLEEVQKIIGGTVEELASIDGRIILVDEEGAAKNLAINARATEFLHPTYAPQKILGPALVVMGDEWG